MNNELPSDIPSDEVLQRYLKDMHRQYKITAIDPTDEDYLSRTVAFLEWSLTVVILFGTMKRLNQPSPEKILNLTNPKIMVPGNGISQIAKLIVSQEEFLEAQIDHSLSDTREVLTKFDKQIDEEKTRSSIRDLYKFLEKSTGGIEVELLDEVVRAGVYRKSTSTDPQQQMKSRALQALTEDLMGDMMEQKLVGINPTSPEGEELSIEIAYWMAGFSSVCTKSLGATLSDNTASTALIETTMNVIARQEVSVEPPLFPILRDTLEDILLNQRMLLIQMSMKKWEDPQINQYAASNMGEFDKGTLISSMQALLDFMKANEGFRTV